MRKYKLGFTLMIIGVICVCGAGVLLLRNHLEEKKAAALADELYQRIVDSLPDEENPATYDDKKKEPYIELDGEGYMGVLQIPALELALPVASRLSEDELQQSPCRYSGKIDNQLVIGAHNYRRHFGPLSRLAYGSEIVLVDAVGVSHRYQVDEMTTVQPTQVKDVTSSGYDLTLFTCNYGGNTRMVIRCSKV